MRSPLLAATTIAATMSALYLSACGTLPTALDYVQHKRVAVVPASIPQFGITKMEAFESPKHPGTIWVQSAGARNAALAWNGRVDQWIAMRQEIEPIYREGGRAALASQGRECELGAATPYPEELGFVFIEICKAQQ